MKHKLDCGVCGREFNSSQKTALTCSDECRKKRAYKTYGFLQTEKRLPSNFVGKLHEMKAIIDLAEKEYDVYYSVFPQQQYDIVVIKRGTSHPLKLEVKTGYKSEVTNKVTFPKHSHSEWDIMCVVIRNNNEIMYFDKEKKEIKI